MDHGEQSKLEKWAWDHLGYAVWALVGLQMFNFLANIAFFVHLAWH